MKQKVFVIFILVNLFLIACGQDKKAPVDDANLKKREEIQGVRYLIPHSVLRILGVHNNATWDEDTAGYGLKGANELFNKISYQSASGTPVLYDGTTPNSDADVSKAARREVYLACEYNSNFIKAFASVINRVASLPEATAKLEELVLKIRDYAKAYYIDVYYTLNKNLGNLGTLSLADVESLRTRLIELEETKKELIDGEIQPIIKAYINDESIVTGVADHHLKNAATTVNEIVKYGEDKLPGVNARLNKIISISEQIKGILSKI
ncbi:virulence associated lipoprotein [Borrelia crocidurae]|uniref:virulence associated lipoprotein n=1 Tax=Borrelia crocidurae TaxID=29520 RepID=UPI00046D10E8|nr:virulence associated lipoprotein [Borrelia crocidurae]